MENNHIGIKSWRKLSKRQKAQVIKNRNNAKKLVSHFKNQEKK